MSRTDCQGGRKADEGTDGRMHVLWHGLCASVCSIFRAKCKNYDICFYKATKAWLGLVCMLAGACVCVCVHVRVCVCARGCYLDGRREVLLTIKDGFVLHDKHCSFQR